MSGPRRHGGGGGAARAARAALVRPLPPIVLAATLSLLVSLAAIAPAEAQVTGRPPAPLPGRPGQVPAGRDTLRRAARDSARAGRDSAAQRELVKWEEPDSVALALQAREGFTVTRYQGRTVVFDARNRVLVLTGDPTHGARAAVARDQALIVGDTVIYNDSTQIVRAIGDTVVLRDPSQGSDVIARGSIEYDAALQRARVSNISTDVTSGERWFVGGKRAAYKATPEPDGAAERAFYVMNGSVTSCDDSIPDYHFEAKEIKLVQNRILAARPAVLYIADIPVMVVPFLFQDLRHGRRSGLLTPRFGVNELFRSSGNYRRHFDNLGYYWAFNDYTDAQTWIDWRSGNGTATQTEQNDPGWIRYNGEWRYRWLDRFLTGRLATSYLKQRDGLTNLSASLAHQQDFSQSSHLTANLNYASSTTLQRQNSFNPYAVLATIGSQLNFQNQLGPFALSLGGDRRQYPGRKQVDQTLPTIALSSQPLSLASWLVWTPSLNATNSENRNIDAGPFRPVLRALPSGGVDTAGTIFPSRRNRQVAFNTPLKIFNFQWANSFNLTDDRNENELSPRNVQRVILGPDGRPLRSSAGGDSVVTESRLFSVVSQSTVDWNTGISLPALFQGTWNLTPSVNIVNVAGGPFWVRSTFSGDQWVHQSKRLQYGVSSTPTFFGLFPGFGPVSRFRQAISPTISYNYAPAAKVSDAYMQALQLDRRTYLGELKQNAVSLGLSTNVEAKLRSGADSAGLGGGTKVKVLALDFDQIGYDFARRGELQRRFRDKVNNPGATKPGAWAGLTSSTMGIRLRSDLLPGFQVNTRYSLFKGDPASDTAVFKPFREEVSATFSLNQGSGLFAALARVFGQEVPETTPGTTPADTTQPADRNDAIARQVLSQPVTGSGTRDAQFMVPTGRGWQGSFTFSSTRQRPVTGSNVIQLDPAQACSPLRNVSAPQYQLCLVNPTQFGLGGAGANLNEGAIGRNAPIYVSPPLTTLGSQISFNITPRWSAAWGTTYDFQRHDFASQIVTVQRELHDWRAIFAYTQSPNGNFAFNFFISLNAQPELKLNFDRRSYPTTNTTTSGTTTP
jgi:hypothetical protein